MTGSITFDALTAGESSVKISNLNMVSDGTATMAVVSQNQTDTANSSSANVELNNCKVSGYNKKGLYLTNVKSLVLKDCVFENCSGAAMDDPNTYGDYVVDLNLCGVQDVDVTIENCTFENNGCQKSNIKVAARGGASDAGASDIPKNVGEATVKNLLVKGCSFISTAEGVEDVTIGTDSKTEGEVENTTGNYPATISENVTAVKAFQKYNSVSVTVPAGETYTKTATGDLTKVM